MNSGINKYGEIEAQVCPECDEPIKPDWKACPHCGTFFGNKPKRNPIPAPVDTRFICKGCGKKATADGGAVFCKICDSFYHKACLTDGERCPLGHGRIDYSGCFIATAVTSSLGMPDDCRELNTLRRFRDTYMARTPSLRLEVERYYRIAPGIVKSIEQRADAPEVWHDLWVSHIAFAIAAIEREDFDEAHRIYHAMVDYVSRCFGDSRWVCP